MTAVFPSIIVSGMRPSGRLHLGHYHGVIENWSRLQKDAQFSSAYFFVADLHAMTTEYENPGVMRGSVKEMVLDWLAYGVDANKATIFVQSQVPEHAELHLILSMITPVGWLERVPSYKDLQAELSNRDLSTYGFLGYPLLQTADVALYHGSHVPVGQDQVPHLELSREIVRRFNFVFKTDLLPEPQPLLTSTPKLPGTDGRKMSKSYGNSIYLSDDAAETERKILPALTDPARKRKSDPGDPDKCPVFDYHRLYSSADTKAEVVAGCTGATIGCVDCKRKLLVGMNATLEPFREKRRELLTQPELVDDVLSSGRAAAQKEAAKNLAVVKDVVGL